MADWEIIQGDCAETLKRLDTESLHCCVTSPPYYGLRDYGIDGQIGLDETPEEYVRKLVQVFREVRRVLRADGTLWLNLGDSYASGGRTYRAPDGKDSKNGRVTGNYRPEDPEGVKPKDLIGIPWMVAFALRADGWYLRSDIIWSKPNCMPESVKDRPTKAHEYIFLLSKSERYHYDQEAVREKPAGYSRKGGSATYTAEGFTTNGVGSRSLHQMAENGRNKRTVWAVNTQPFPGAHFATFPPKLIEPCILAGCPKGGTVLDPFSGAGTTGVVALQHGRRYVGIELNPDYVRMSEKRLREGTRQVSLFD